MSMNNRISARALLAVASLAFSPAAWSLGLGDATVESYLNQPLRARIDLLTQDTDDLASVSASLASAADYELIGASLEDISVPIRFTVEDIDGDAYLLASSQLPLNNPVIRLIVEVNWSSGRMLREYTLFLDPPMVSDVQAPLPRIDQREQATVGAPAPEPAAAPASTEPAPPPAPAESATLPARVPSRQEYGPVASGETLWRIARDWSAGTGMNINQVMIAIQRENPQAFMRNNINLLKRGAILRMPAVADVENISRRDAYAEVATQEEAIYGHGPGATPTLASDSLAYPSPREPVVEAGPDAVTEPGLAPVPEAASEAAEAETTAAEPAPETESDAYQPSLPELQDQLELVPPSEASELESSYGFEESEQNGEATQALREDLARAEEDLITQQQQNEYLEERIRDLEAQLEENRNATVADAELAGMEQRLREERQADDAEEPWYARFGLWLLGLVVLVAALLGWLLSRRKSEVGEEAVQEIVGEAEEVLRVLDEPSASDSDVEEDDGSPAEADEKPAGEPDDTAPIAVTSAAFGAPDDEADVLDEDSSDPEIQLDLARAYISMGDKEAARVILEEVAANGSEEQQAEAKKMLDLM